MTTYMTALLLLVGCAGGYAPSQTSAADKTTISTDRTAISMELQRGHAYVSVWVNNQGPFRFAVDTGFAGEALVSNAVADRLHLSPAGTRIIGDPSGFGDRTVRSYQVSTIRLGEETFTNVDAGEDLVITGPDGPRDGVLGFGFFKHHLFSLDYPNKQLVVSRGTLSREASSEAIPYTLSSGVPTVLLRYGHTTISADTDSGGMGFSIPESLAKSLSFETKPIVVGRMMTASHSVEIRGGQLSGDLKLGAYVFRSPFVEVNPLFRNATLGAIPLSRFRISFDEDRQLVRFESRDQIIEITPPRRHVMQSPPPF